MNLSGRAVRAALDFYKVPVGDLLVVCDDIDLPLGKLRVRAKGRPRRAERAAEHPGAPRHRRTTPGCGSGSGAGEHLDAVDHVLSRFKPGERAAVEEAVAQAAQAVLLWVRQGIDVCMNRVNGEPKRREAEEREAGEGKGRKGRRRRGREETTTETGRMSQPCQ